MFFKEQARIFVQLIISKAPSIIFISWYLTKKELCKEDEAEAEEEACMLTHVP